MSTSAQTLQVNVGRVSGVTGVMLDYRSGEIVCDYVLRIPVISPSSFRFNGLENQLDQAKLRAPGQRQHAIDMLRSIDAELRAHREALDPQV